MFASLQLLAPLRPIQPHLAGIWSTRTSKLVWRGWAEGSMDGVIDRQEWMEARIDDAVTRILQRLPRGL